MLLEVWDENINQLRAEREAEAAQAAADKQLAHEKKLQAEAEKLKNEPPPLYVDSNTVRRLQQEAIKEQHMCAPDTISKQNNFTDWLDEFHQLWYCRMDNAVRRVDTMWLKDDGRPYDYELSTFYLRLLGRVGGRSNDGTEDFKVRFSGDIALPGLENKLHLVLNNSVRDSLPGADPLTQQSEATLGVRTMWRQLRHSQFSLGGGLKWRSSVPVVYGELDWQYKRDLAGGEFRLDPRGFWYSDDGFGQVTSMTWTRQTYKKQWLQLRAAERSTEQTDGIELEQTLRYVWLRSGNTRGWVAQASAFPHLKSSTWYWDDFLVNLSWRDALYRKWIYYTVTPQIDFPEEDNYKVRPSLRIGIEILFGGKIGNLI